MKHKFLTWLLFLFGLMSALQAHAQNPFVAVFVDDATEKVLGPFPYDRSKYAEALKSLRQAGAKGVVVKFFLDQAKPGTGDDQLAAEIKLLPVLLQARLDPKEPKPNTFPPRFDRAGEIKGDAASLLSGESGWIPLEKFSRNGVGIGFVDIASPANILSIPMVLRYQKALVPSLELTAVEMALGKTSQIELNKQLTLAGHHLPLSAPGEISVQLPAKDEINYISFIDVLNGKVDPKKIAGKIVVLGFDAKETPTLPTTLGPLRIHRVFFYSLESLYEQLIAH